MRLGFLGVCVASAALAAGVGTMGSAAHDGSLHQDSSGRPLRMLLSGQFGRLLTLRSELRLSEEQRGQIEAIIQSHRDEIVALAKPIAEKWRAMRDANAADETAIRAAADDLGKAIGDLAVLAAKIRAEVNVVLTPDQRVKIGNFRKQANGAVDDFFSEVANPR